METTKRTNLFESRIKPRSGIVHFIVFFSFPFFGEDIVEWDPVQGGIVKTLLAITTGVGVATLLFAGYVFLSAVPDVGRYIKISRM